MWFLFQTAYWFMFMSSSLLYVFIVCVWNHDFYFSLLVFFLHMRLCILFKCFRKYTGWFIWATVYSYNWWIVVRLNLCFWALFCKGHLLVNFELFKVCFVTDCQGGSLLGSKDLGFMFLESNLYYWQTMIKTMYLSCFKSGQSWFFVVKLECNTKLFKEQI